MLLTGLEEPIKHSFLSVFNHVNSRTDAWVSYRKLITSGANRYAKYLRRAVGSFALFGTNREAQIDQAYVKVVLTDRLRRERYRSSEVIEEELRTGSAGQHLSGSALDIFDALESTDKSIALVGIAGSGKTTAFRYLTLRAASGAEIRGRRRLPIYLPVREMEPGATIEQSIESLFRSLEISRPKLVYRLLRRSGTLMLVLDGIDETTNEHRTQLLRELSHLHHTAPEAILCVSGRPFSLSTEFTGFLKWETLPLGVDARLAFVRKWFEPVDPQKGARLVAECEASPKLLQLGDRPLFLSIICALYYNELEIPSAAEELYDRTISGLLGQWDAFRNIARTTSLKGLSIRDRQTLVSWLAYSMFSAGRKAFAPKHYLQRHGLHHVKSLVRKDIPAAEDVLASLYNDFGILIEQSPGYYTFTHLSVQEYLAARHLVDFRIERNLLNYLTDPEWLDVFYYVARIMPDSTDLLMELHRRADVGDSRAAAALLRYWAAEPVFRRGMERKIFAKIFQAINEDMAALKAEVFELRSEVGGTRLMIGLPADSHMTFQRLSWVRRSPDLIAVYLQMAKCTKVRLTELNVARLGGSRSHLLTYLIENGEPAIAAVSFWIIEQAQDAEAT